ncbi:uncharacterized protein STEHIDRAFT_125340 [Stereum hirsutum FP-91666 SS1]|uniref:uncharacterized protein n=1 Tax=Stereum hirsutum (strain FP-91666) TaxID=721885 RepID=UPI0004449926|nr:uncharacterized protein STEHIDRAFT_125340 [Stereum hirsutum FP-91666 SS1]EIM81065.1 hypothetical protein STEHIDRAFT_125340 [Stereum hirsutum FP-91666 SS1]
MHQALSITEILSLIFSELQSSAYRLSKADNCRNARVCRTWSEIALGEVWRVVDLGQVFRSLAPMSLENDSIVHHRKLLTGRNQ